MCGSKSSTRLGAGRALSHPCRGAPGTLRCGNIPKATFDWAHHKPTLRPRREIGRIYIQPCSKDLGPTFLPHRQLTCRRSRDLSIFSKRLKVTLNSKIIRQRAVASLKMSGVRATNCVAERLLCAPIVGCADTPVMVDKTFSSSPYLRQP